jgi:hypothetical protein
MKHRIVNAVVKHFQAEAARAEAELEVYLNNPCGIGEHPQIVEEVIKLVDAYDAALSKIETFNYLIDQLNSSNVE